MNQKGGAKMKNVNYNLVENGRRLAALRGNKKQAEVAAANKISVSALAMYESGQRNPRDEVKISLAEYYNVPVSDIFFP